MDPLVYKQTYWKMTNLTDSWSGRYEGGERGEISYLLIGDVSVGVPANKRRSFTDQGRYLGKFCPQGEHCPSTTALRVTLSRYTTIWASSSGRPTTMSPAPLRNHEQL